MDHQGGGTVISGGGTPDTGGGTPFRPVLAEFNHCISYNKALAMTDSRHSGPQLQQTLPSWPPGLVRLTRSISRRGHAQLHITYNTDVIMKMFIYYTIYWVGLNNNTK